MIDKEKQPSLYFLSCMVGTMEIYKGDKIKQNAAQVDPGKLYRNIPEIRCMEREANEKFNGLYGIMLSPGFWKNIFLQSRDGAILDSVYQLNPSLSGVMKTGWSLAFG